jgi:hypothetical protein
MPPSFQDEDVSSKLLRADLLCLNYISYKKRVLLSPDLLLHYDSCFRPTGKNPILSRVTTTIPSLEERTIPSLEERTPRLQLK